MFVITVNDLSFSQIHEMKAKSVHTASLFHL